MGSVGKTVAETREERISRTVNKTFKTREQIQQETGESMVDNLKNNKGSTATNKSQEQIFAETDQLKSLPSGTQIEVKVDGKWVTYTAHDQARMGRNGRMSRIRRYSIVESNTTNRNLPPVVARDTSDPYYIAEKPWRKKRR